MNSYLVLFAPDLLGPPAGSALKGLAGTVRGMTRCQLICCNPAPMAVVDLETTGLDPYEDRVVELAVVGLDPWGNPDGRDLVTLVNPGMRMGATYVHGVTGRMVKSAPTFEDLSGDLVDVLSGRVLVAHNAYFDARFLGRELTRAGRARGILNEGERFDRLPTMCTMWSGSQVLYGKPAMVGLACMCEDLGIDLLDAHCAHADAWATGQLTRAVLEKARREGTHVRAFGDPQAPALTAGAWPRLGRGAVLKPRLVELSMV